MDLKTKIYFLNKHNTKNNVFKLHSHDCYELVYFLAGSGKTIIGDKSYPVYEHTYCIIPPHVDHIECIEGYGEILFIGIKYESSSKKLKEGVYNNGEMKKYMLLNEIFREYRDQKAGYTIAAQALLELFLIDILRNSTTDNKKEKDLKFIKTYIEQHFDQKINFGEISTLSGYSNDYFRQMFKQEFGVAPQEYMINIRLKKAKELLRNTDLSCTEIAYQCGFSNSAQMSAMFKQKLKITPMLYRTTDLYK